MIDLHTHTLASDGTSSPKDLVDQALAIGLSAMAITDHDTVEGLLEAKDYVQKNKLPIDLVEGIEFSTRLKGYSPDLHILGLFIDAQSKAFQDDLTYIINERENRNHKMIKKLQDIGYDLSYDQVKTTNPDGVITRAHFAKAMVEKGLIPERDYAFSHLIGSDCPAFVPREKMTPQMAIDWIHQAGGYALLAHPSLYGLDKEDLMVLFKGLARLGLDGIEAIYTLYSPEEEAFFKEAAKTLNFVISGGSDYHGGNKPKTKLGFGFGNLKIPDSLLDQFKR